MPWELIGEQVCSEAIFFAVPVCRAGPINAITWKIFSPVRRDPGIAIPGSGPTGLGPVVM